MRTKIRKIRAALRAEDLSIFEDFPIRGSWIVYCVEAQVEVKCRRARVTTRERGVSERSAPSEARKRSVEQKFENW